MESKRFFRASSVILLVIIIGIVIYWKIYQHSPGEIDKVVPRLTSSAVLDWNNPEFVQEIRRVLNEDFKESYIEYDRPLSILKTSDLTRDGVLEALVDIGSGGAYARSIILMRLENNKPTPANFKKKDGEVSYARFLDGSSARNGTTTEIVPEKSLIYQGYYHVGDSGNIEGCYVEAYQWNDKSETFEWSAIVSGEVTKSYCEAVALNNGYPTR